MEGTRAHISCKILTLGASSHQSNFFQQHLFKFIFILLVVILRESDYGIVAREFEAMVDEYMVAAVQQTPGQAAMAAATSQSTKGGGSGRSSPKSIEGGSGRSSPNNLGGGSGRSTPVPGSGRLTPSMHLGHATNASAPSPAAISAATEAAAAAVTRPATKAHESKKS